MTRVDDFLAESSYSPSTIETYRQSLVRLETWLAERGLDLADLSGADFARWRDGISTSQATRRVAHCATRAYVKWAYGEHPILRVKCRRVRPSPQRTLDGEEVRRLLGWVEPEDPAAPGNAKRTRDWSMISLMLDSGLRASEICRLQMDHLDLERRRLVVETKGGSWGIGLLSPQTRVRLKFWLSHRQRLALPGVTTVFVGVGGNTRGQPLTRDGLRTIFQQLAAAAGLKPFTPHSLRRTFACQMISAGASSRAVQLAGRWQDIRLLEVYTQQLDLAGVDRFLPTTVLA